MYLTDFKGDIEPCVKVYEGKKLSWYFCEGEKELFQSLLNLIKVNKKPRIYNVYGREIYIPNDPEDFKVREEVENFKGIIFSYSQIVPLIPYISQASIINSKNRKLVKVKLKGRLNAEEVLKLGIQILEPVVLPMVKDG